MVARVARKARAAFLRGHEYLDTGILTVTRQNPC